MKSKNAHPQHVPKSTTPVPNAEGSPLEPRTEQPQKWWRALLGLPLLSVAISAGSFVTAFLAYRSNDVALRQVQRPYLTVECEPDKESNSYRVQVRNLGNTPALNTVVHAVGFKDYQGERTKKMEALGPKEARLLVKSMFVPTVFSSTNFALKGELKYSDIFGAQHEEPFCFQALAGDIYICDDSKGPGRPAQVP